MMRRSSAGRAGFTIIELMIVVVIIAIVAAIAIPNLLSARVQANETATISAMRTITSAQAQFQRSGYADENGNGSGEFGFLGELGGTVGVRSGARKVTADLPESMSQVTAAGEVHHNGYVFRVFLPASGGLGVGEAAGGGVASGVLSPTLAEVRWSCYAIPARHTTTGNRTFLVNERCDIVSTEDDLYQGAACTALFAGAAMIVGDVANMTGDVAVGTRGADGNFWKAVQ